VTVVNEYLLIPPDWGNSFIYRRKWQTSIQSAINGIEKRSALLTWPRRTLSYYLSTQNYSSSNLLKRKLYKNLHNVWGIPFWQDKTKLTSQALSGSAILNVQSTQNRNFEVGGSCLLYGSENLYEVKIISSFTNTEILLSSNLAITWPIRTEVYPILKGRLKTDIGLDMNTSVLAEMQIEAMEEYDDTVTRQIGDVSGFSFYKGYPLFDLEPSWGKVSQTFIHPYNWNFYLGKGITLSYFNETDFGLKMDHVIKEKSNIQKYLDFFDGQKGRWGGFWIPSWQFDIKITEPFLATAFQLAIEPMDFPGYWLNTNAGAHLIIFWPDGSYACDGIIDASSMLLTLDEEIGKACLASEISHLLVCFLYFARFTQDEIQVEYVTDELAKTSLSFQTQFSATLAGVS